MGLKFKAPSGICVSKKLWFTTADGHGRHVEGIRAVERGSTLGKSLGERRQIPLPE